MRKLLAPFGLLIGPIAGTALYLFLRIVNGRRRLIAAARTPPGGTKAVAFLLVNNARCIPSGAITFGSRIYTKYRIPSAQLVNHELVHVEQYGRWGWVGFLARYFYEWIARGSEGNLLEVEARLRSPGTH